MTLTLVLISGAGIESRLLPATSQASSVQVEGNLPPAALLDGIPGPEECDIEPLKWDEEVRAFYQEVIQNLIKAGSPVATSNDDPGTHPWPRVAAAFIGDFKWKEKVLLSILLLFGVALIGAEIFFLRNNVRRTSLVSKDFVLVIVDAVIIFFFNNRSLSHSNAQLRQLSADASMGVAGLHPAVLARLHHRVDDRFGRLYLLGRQEVHAAQAAALPVPCPPQQHDCPHRHGGK